MCNLICSMWLHIIEAEVIISKVDHSLRSVRNSLFWSSPNPQASYSQTENICLYAITRFKNDCLMIFLNFMLCSLYLFPRKQATSILIGQRFVTVEMNAGHSELIEHCFRFRVPAFGHSRRGARGSGWWWRWHPVHSLQQGVPWLRPVSTSVGQLTSCRYLHDFLVAKTKTYSYYFC